MTQLLELGSDFAGYRIEALIGRGGMGEVYKAEHPRLGSKVALKLLAPELAQEELFRERFVRESRLAASLNHPNVIPIFDAGEEQGLPYIAMRYVAGPDLKSLIERDGPLPLERALAIVSQVGSALDCGHENALIHRDVKPGNILLEEGRNGAQAHVYLSDFGVAKHTLSRSGLTTTGQFVGTIDYIAPEQIEGKPLDGRADVYSLGCVLFEALTGLPPFERESNVAMMYAHLLESPPTLSERRPDLPSDLDAVVSTALAKDPSDRYPTCRALVDAVCERSRPSAAPATVAAPADPTVAAAAPPTVPAAATTAQAPAPAPARAASAPPLAAGPPPAPPVFSAPDADGAHAPRRRGRKRLVALAALVAVAVVAATAAGMSFMDGGSSSPAKDHSGSDRTTTGEGRLSEFEAKRQIAQQKARRERAERQQAAGDRIDAERQRERVQRQRTARANRVDRVGRRVNEAPRRDRIREPFTGGSTPPAPAPDRIREQPPAPPPPPPPPSDRLRGGSSGGGSSSGGDRLRP
jgi:hypothetical protein